MALVRALMVFVLLWGVCAVAVHLFTRTGGRQRWAWSRLLKVSAAAAVLASGVLWAIVALF